MYPYAYEFEWNRECVYRYDWFAYEDLNVSSLGVHVCLYYPKVVECMYMSITERYDVETCTV
jgi:hypothetical protein